MTVDVTWDGVALAKGATIREQDGGWFVELEQPMPVGTRVVLTGELDATVTVARVHEGIGAGMLLRKGDARPAAAAAPAVVDAGGGEPEAGAGEKKEKRKKKR